MNLLRLFADEEKIGSKVATLLSKKEHLKEIIIEGINEYIKNEFRTQDYQQVREKNKALIEELENSLYKEFYEEIDIKINQLQLLQKEISRNYPLTRS